MRTLVVGATGNLGFAICQRLSAMDMALRALTRETSDARRVSELRELGAEIVRGDLRDRPSLDHACEQVNAVVSTATSIIREGEISAVDEQGQLSLVDAAKEAGVSRFVLVSFEELGTGAPLEAAKRAVERRLAQAGIDYTVIRAGLFHETWLTPAVGFDPAAGTASIYGSGDQEISWISLGDAATATARALLDPDAENEIISLASERLSYHQVISTFEQVTGRTFSVQHVPDHVLQAQRDYPQTDERGKSFAGLMLGVAGGSPPGEGESWLRRLGVESPRTVRDVAATSSAPGAAR